MLEKVFLYTVAMVGLYTSITGTLPSAVVALFGNTSVLGTKSLSISAGLEEGGLGQIEQILGELHKLDAALP